VQTTPAVAVGRRDIIDFHEAFAQAQNFRNYDIASDGKRFALVGGVNATDFANSIDVVVNWYDELKQRVPPR